MSDFIANFADLEVLLQVYPLLLQGLLLTFLLSIVIVPGGILVGLVVAILYSLHLKWLNRLLIFYVDFFRAFPPLVLLIFVYYGLPFLGIRLDAFPAAVLALVLNTSGYYGEIFRAGLESIPSGQHEAAQSTGLTVPQTLMFVVLPQALRNVIPPVTTNTLEVIKNTSIAAVVALPELLRSAQVAQGLVFNATPLVAAALIYFVLLLPLVRLVSRFERQQMVGR